jgi:diguanylate cyclase (GGDEF)-like protein
VPYGGKFMNVGASIGIAFKAEPGENAARLLQAADTTLYRAKDDGRNRYEFAQA